MKGDRADGTIHEIGDVGDCERCGKSVWYGRFAGFCGPCYIRSRDTGQDESQ